MPPHIFAISDNAYHDMLQNRENQSLLITGESGAGKTENTKKVIQYLASIAGDCSSTEGETLEKQIILANPILESFGNAQTIRNNNSSRFGKFIRIEFNSSGTISGANIERYLLEKSRVTHQTSKERNYHIFYQFLKGAPAELKKQLLIDGGVNDYAYIKNSNKNIDGVDDAADFKLLKESMEVMKFNEAEQVDFFRVISTILLLGNMQFKEDRDNQAQLSETTVAEKVCFLLGIPMNDFVKGLLKPLIKAGRDWVSQARDVAQVTYSVEALARSLYERMFSSLVERINNALDKPSSVHTFIGVLDIAGFEIFEKNSFEQLCINYTNEKLQQFFNHHMFILEQEEYKKEGIEWKFIDFGLDLQPTIDLIEKANPIGVLSCLDEDCVMPKATDKSFTEKLNSIWKGKSGKYEVPRFQSGFILSHYAGKVEYSTEGWLDKNKDPLNENITKLLANSSEKYVRDLFSDYSGTDDDISSKVRGKKGQFRTVAQKHKEQLTSLMTQLYSTQPHFVRCIIPNEEKKFGKILGKLVQDQLRCNGVLEGIRICRQGYPNRLTFADFRQRYEIIIGGGLHKGFMDGKKAAIELLEKLSLDKNQYKIGATKVFFKAGVLAELEDIRDAKLNKIFTSFTSICKGFLQRREHKRKLVQLKAIRIIQKNARVYVQLREWPWWKMYSKVKPLLNVTRVDEELKKKEERLAELEANLKKESEERRELEERKSKLENEKKRIEEEITKERNINNEQNEIIARMRQELSDFEEEIQCLKEDLKKKESKIDEISKSKGDKEAELINLNKSMAELKQSLERLEREKSFQENQMKEFNEELLREKSEKESLEKDKKEGEKANFELSKKIEDLNEKFNDATRQKNKLQGDLNEKEDILREKIAEISKLEKKNTSMEDEIKLIQVNVVDANEVIMKKKESEINSLKEDVRTLKTQIESIDKEKRELKQLLEEEKIKNEQIEVLKKEKSSLCATIEKLKIDFEEEDKKRSLLESQKKKLHSDFQEINAKLEEEIELKNDLVRKLSLKTSEFDSFREKKEAELNARIEVISKEKTALEVQFQELKVKCETLDYSISTLEKTKGRLVQENEDLKHEIEKEHLQLRGNEKNLKQVEKNFSELQLRFENEKKQTEALYMNIKQLESTNSSLQNELALKQTQFNSVLKNKETIENELNSLIAGRNVFELEKEKKRVDQRITELEEQLAELSCEKDKLSSLNLDLQKENEQLTVSLKRKEEIADETRQVLMKEINSMGEMLEKEVKEKNDLVKEKKRLSSEIEDLMNNMDKGKNEIDKSKKKLESAVKDLTAKLENEEKSKKNLEDLAARHEKKSNALQTEMERLESQLDSLEKSKKAIQEQLDALENEIDQKTRDSNEEKRKLNAQLESLQEQLEQEKELKKTIRIDSAKEEEYLNTISQLEESKKALLLQQKMTLQQLDEKQKEMFMLEKQLKTFSAELSDMKALLDQEIKAKNDESDQKRRLQFEIKELNIKLESEISKSDELADSINLFRNKCEIAQSKCEMMENMKEKAEKAEILLKSKLSEIQDNYTHVCNQLKSAQDKISELESQNYQLVQKADELSLENTDLQDMRRKLKDELDALKETSRSDLLEKEVYIDGLKKKMSRENASLLDELEYEKKSTLSLKDQLKQLEAMKDELTKALDTESRTCASLRKEKEKMEAQLNEMESSSASSMANHESLHNQLLSLTNQLRESKTQCQDLEALKFTLEKQKVNLESSLAELSNENTDLMKSKQQAERSATLLQNELVQLRTSLKEKTDSLVCLEEKSKKIESQMASLSNELSKEKEANLNSVREKSLLERQIRDLSSQISEVSISQESCKRLELQITNISTQLEAEVKEKQEYLKEFRKTDRLYKDLSYQNQEVLKSKGKLEEDLVRCEDKYKKARAQLDTLEISESDLQIRNRKVERENEELRARIAQLESMKKGPTSPQ